MATVFSPTRMRLLKLSQHITEKDVEMLKFLCKEIIPAGHSEQIRNSIMLFTKLEELDLIRADNMDFLEQLLEAIGKLHLKNILYGENISVENGSSNSLPKLADIKQYPESNKRPCLSDICSIDNDILLLVSEEIGKDWRRLGRYLKVSESKLESIDIDVWQNQDKGNRVLHKWIQDVGVKDATVANLKKALSRMPRNDIKDLIEKMEGKPGTSLKVPTQESGPDDENVDSDKVDLPAEWNKVTSTEQLWSLLTNHQDSIGGCTVDDCIILRSHYNKWLTACQDTLTNNKDTIDQSCSFQPNFTPDGCLVLQTWKGKYISAQFDGRLEANRDQVEACEKFKLYVSEDKLSLKSCHDKWLSAKSDGKVDVCGEERDVCEIFSGWKQRRSGKQILHPSSESDATDEIEDELTNDVNRLNIET